MPSTIRLSDQFAKVQSLLKFFLSEEIDIDKFKATKRIKISSLIGRSKDIGGDDPSALNA